MEFLLESQLPPDWQDTIETGHEALTPGRLRLLLKDYFLAIVHAAPAKFSFFVEEYFPRFRAGLQRNHVCNFARDHRRADDDAELGIDVCRAGIEVERSDECFSPIDDECFGVQRCLGVGSRYDL